MRLRPRAFISDGGVKRGKVDRPRRLGAEHKRIELDAVAVDAQLKRQLTQAVEALLRLRLEAAFQQVRGGKLREFSSACRKVRIPLPPGS
jgi:hypothetical protein